MLSGSACSQGAVCVTPSRARWADIESSQGTCEESLTVPHIDTSYHETPVKELDHSKTGLNGKLTRATALEPRDFSFLLKAHPSDVSENWEVEKQEESSPVAPSRLLDCAMVPTEGATDFSFLLEKDEPAPLTPEQKDVATPPVSTSKHKLNASAPAFVPTLSNVCSAVPVLWVPEQQPEVHPWQIATPQRGSLAPEPLQQQRNPAEESMHPLQPDAFPGRCDLGSAEGAAAFANQKRRRSSTGEGRTLARKRSRVEEGESTVLGELPPATEEEWQHRIKKRRESIDVVKALVEYGVYSNAVPRKERTTISPATPDFMDRNMSKRKWKYEVMQWRKDVIQWCDAEAPCGLPSRGGGGL